MRLMKINQVEKLINLIDETSPDIIIIEGHDGAGKGRVVKEIVRNLGLKVYRPDYGYWNDHVTTKKRWTISAAFFDLIKLVGVKDKLVIDRCMVSGAVYEENVEIAKKMAEHCESVDILHILVDTDRDSYYKMQGVRLGENIPRKPYGLFRNYNDRFIEYMDKSDIDYVVFQNEFDVKVGNKSVGCCGGCDNWSTLRQSYDNEKLVGYCAHWKTEMLENGKRCEFYEKESDYNGDQV